MGDEGGRKLTYVAGDAAGIATTFGGNDARHAVLERAKNYAATRGKRIR